MLAKDLRLLDQKQSFYRQHNRQHELHVLIDSPQTPQGDIYAAPTDLSHSRETLHLRKPQSCKKAANKTTQTFSGERYYLHYSGHKTSQFSVLKISSLYIDSRFFATHTSLKRYSVKKSHIMYAER